MMKAFLTNPELAKDTTVLTFDKKELKKLQKRLLEEPEKFEEVLVKDLEVDPWLSHKDTGRFKEWKHMKWLNREYDFAFHNDGRSAQDFQDVGWPWRGEYYQYKDWVEGIREKALDTLQLIVARLLQDFNNMPKLNNKVEKVYKSKNESKHQALARIYEMLSTHQRVDPVYKKEVA